MWAGVGALLTIVALRSAFAETELVYTNPIYGWSMKYPANWSLDSSDVAFVRILSPENDGVCGVLTGPVQFKSAEEFTDFMLAHSAQTFKRRGLEVAISSRQQIVLLSGITGTNVLVEIVPGGRSRRIFVLADGNGLVVDCETYAANWQKLAPTFDRIMGSIDLGEQN
jgi:hypothetical protein